MTATPRSEPNGDRSDDSASAAIDYRVQMIAQQYFEALCCGQAPERRQVEQAHPELAPWLGRRLRLMELLREAATDTEGSR